MATTNTACTLLKGMASAQSRQPGTQTKIEQEYIWKNRENETSCGCCEPGLGPDLNINNVAKGMTRKNSVIMNDTVTIFNELFENNSLKQST